MNIRLFVAAEIDEDIRKKLVEFQDNLKKADADVGWVAPENLHITLKFIGYIDQERIGDIIQIIQGSVTHIKSFDLDYRGVGVFPSKKNPRVVFAQVTDTGGTLAKIHERLDNQMAALGVSHDDRRFESHLTVGRIKTRRNVHRFMEKLDAYNDFHFGLEHISQIVLMESDLLPEGPRYTKLESVDLIR